MQYTETLLDGRDAEVGAATSVHTLQCLATSITSHVTGYTHNITTPINCNTERAIYACKCTKYNFSINSNNKISNAPVHNNLNNDQASNYIGRTTRKLKKRIYEHTNYVNVKNLEEPSAEHFCKPGHKVHNLLAVGLVKVISSDPFILKAREHRLIKSLILLEMDSIKNHEFATTGYQNFFSILVVKQNHTVIILTYSVL